MLCWAIIKLTQGSVSHNLNKVALHEFTIKNHNRKEHIYDQATNIGIRFTRQ